MQHVESIISQLGTAIFAKDLSGRYIYCNEQFAQGSGEDSPTACFGKKDRDVIWKKYAHVCEQSDMLTLKGHSLCNVVEPHNQLSCPEMQILVNKQPLLNKAGRIIGVVGSFVDVTGLNIVPQNQTYIISNTSRFDLGQYFDHATLTKREYQVLKKLLLGQTAKQIAYAFDISPKTIETHIAKIKLKMQCESRGEIISQAVQSGLYHRLMNVLTSQS